MKNLLFVLFMMSTLFSINCFATAPKYTATDIPKTMSVVTKKKRFFYLLVPSVNKVYRELMTQYNKVKKDLEMGANREKIQNLKSIYKVKSDRDLLLALKPHPRSITLAQAAMESAWGTSRFFVQANNVFGVWSINKEEARIAAGEKRDEKKTIWLKKFNSIEDSVREYYKMMGRAPAYKEFRRVRYETDDVMQIIKKLGSYSEIGEKYIEEISSIIKYNKLEKYDRQ